MVKWTKNQQNAFTLDGNLLVAAAAGSGKTAVLTERVIRLVKEGTPINRLLVITFTKAAAAEMNKRIQKELAGQLLEAADEAERRLISRALDGLPKASISTIDSFCQDIIRSNFQTAEIDPDFRVLDENEAAILCEDVLYELVEELPEQFAAISDLFSEGTDSIVGYLLELRARLMSMPEPLNWLRRAADAHDIDLNALKESEHIKEIEKYIRRNIEAALDGYDAILSEEGLPAGVARFMNDEKTAVSALAGLSYEQYMTALFSFDYSQNKSWGNNYPDEAFKKRINGKRDSLKKIVAKMKEFALEPEQQLAMLKELKPSLYKLCEIMEALFDRYARTKRHSGLIDFGDMEHIALALLNDDAVTERYRAKFDHIFVDEYQDVSPIQEAIFDRIKRRDNLFLVGDVKQSIYRFRNADPSLFLQKFHSFSGETGLRVDLSENFRSAGSIIDAVNGLFRDIMLEETGELNYDSASELNKFRAEEGKVEFHIIDDGAAFETESEAEGDAEEDEERDEQEDKEEEVPPTLIEQEAMTAAQRIEWLINNRTVPDRQGGQRRIEYRDIAVLLRTKAGTQIWVDTLASRGIPAYAELSGGYFDAIEVSVFLNLLRVIDNMRQDIPLVSVLRSPIGGFTDGELALLKAECDAPDYAGRLDIAREKQTPYGEKAKAFLGKLDKWRMDAKLLSVTELISMLITETEYGLFVSALPGGKQRTANLDALLERAQTYEKNGVRGIYRFIKNMERTNATAEMGFAQIGAANVVKILTMHKSKGLEFPVVILGSLGKKINFKSNRDPIILHNALGLGLKYVMRSQRQKSIYYKAITLKKHDEQLAEEMRLLYVSMTRARDYLVMLGSVKKLESKTDWKQPLNPRRILNAASMLDWIYPHAYTRAEEGCAISITLHGMPGTALASQYLEKSKYEEWAKNAMQNAAPLSEFEWRYPHDDAVTLPSKTSVTGLSGRQVSLTPLPTFFAEEAIKKMPTATDRGSAAHDLLQSIRLIPTDSAGVESEIRRLTEARKLSAAQAELINPEAVSRFLNSELGKRLCASNRTEREFEFNCLMPASELYEGRGSEQVLLQGIIDCCFLEDGEWVLIDYKTDRVPQSLTPKAVANMHAVQLRLYAHALELLSGIKVKQKYIHLLSINQSVEMED